MQKKGGTSTERTRSGERGEKERPSVEAKNIQFFFDTNGEASKN